MQTANFANLDLNLLRVFDVMVEERSVTRAGQRIGLSQSAVSHALNRLRYALGDELFVRSADGMTPTARALDIWPDVRRGLHQLQNVLAPTTFVPAESRRAFTISASAYLGEVLMPHVVARVRAEAPGVQLRIRLVDHGLAEALETGRVDLALGVFGRTSDLYAREPLFTERLVWAVRADQPEGSGELTVDQLRHMPLMILAPGDPANPQQERGHRGIERRVMWEEMTAETSPLGVDASERARLIIDNSPAALAILSRSDLAGLVPRRLARVGEAAGAVRLIEPPPGLNSEVDFETLWRADLTTHPAVSWLRAIVRDCAAAA